MTESVTKQAKRFVSEQLDDPDKDSKAAARILRKRCNNRADPMSKAIQAELDRRARRHDPLAGWEGWER